MTYEQSILMILGVALIGAGMIFSALLANDCKAVERNFKSLPGGDE